MKKSLCIILAAIAAFSLASCSNGEKHEEIAHKIYVRDDSKSEKITAKFINSSNGNTAEKAMDKISEGEDFSTFSVTGDAGNFNKVSFTYDSSETYEVAFNEYVSGWYISTFGMVPYTEGKDNLTEVKYETKTFDYKDYKKDVYIWTPKGYDKKSKDKYSVIYTEDGERTLFAGTSDSTCWNVAESVTSMMSLSDNRAIIVAISTPEGTTRSEELTPDIGELKSDDLMFQHKEGKYFSDFVCNTVMPYIEKNYNVYTDGAHNSICGSSLGGLESFYIGMEHPDKFGAIGAMSSTFSLFDMDTWKEYISAKKFDENSPFIYFYAGDDKADGGKHTRQMYDYMTGVYPKDKLFCDTYSNGEHLTEYWRYIFPEFLKYAFRK